MRSMKLESSFRVRTNSILNSIKVSKLTTKPPTRTQPRKHRQLTFVELGTQVDGFAINSSPQIAKESFLDTLRLPLNHKKSMSLHYEENQLFTPKKSPLRSIQNKDFYVKYRSKKYTMDRLVILPRNKYF